MGAPESGMQAADQVSADELLGAFKRIDAADRRTHESVLNYWLSIRGDKELPSVAISRDFLAFQDEFATAQGKTRCWVTLLPLSAGGAWVDYVYAVVTVVTEVATGAEPAKKAAKKPEPEPEPEEVAAEAE